MLAPWNIGSFLTDFFVDKCAYSFSTPKHRPSYLARSQSSRQNRPPRGIDAQVAAGGERGTILGGGDSDEEMGGVFGRARHTSL